MSKQVRIKYAKDKPWSWNHSTLAIVMRLVSLVLLGVTVLYSDNVFVFIFAEYGIAILLFLIVISELPIPKKEAWVPEYYYKRYKWNYRWFFICYLTSHLLAFLAGSILLIMGEIKQVMSWVPMLHIWVAFVRLVTYWILPTTHLPSNEEMEEIQKQRDAEE
ncbi:hypothetical protein ACFL0C_01620 [Patescibacteria group bacterium]